MEAVVERSKVQVTEFCYFQRKVQKTGSEDLVSDISTCALDVSQDNPTNAVAGVSRLFNL
jgi:hypothetical protein